MNYKDMKTTELRSLVRSRRIANGEGTRNLTKAECINLLEDNDAVKRLDASTTQSVSTPPPQRTQSTDLMDIILKNVKEQGISSLDEPKVISLIEQHAMSATKADELLKTIVENMEQIIDKRMKKLELPVTVNIKNNATGTTKDMGIQHKCFVTLLKIAQARDKDGHVPNIYLHGPAGTGKTTGAQKLAEALNLPFYFNGAIDSEYKLSGFVDASGTFQSRPFYEAYKNGGVYLFDELDSSMPSAVLAFNASLANGHADFPIGKVERHKDCIIIGAGNTTLRGDGYSDGFQRNEMDGAFRDRFSCFIAWPIDEALEASCVPTDYKHWLEIVRKARKAVKEHGIKKHEVTPRATFSGIALLQQEIGVKDVVDMVLRKGLPDDNWSKISDAIRGSI